LNKAILKTGIQQFIKNNWNTDIVSVLLKKPYFEEVNQKELVEQLEAKKKCKDKLPTWFAIPQIYYPKKIHIEQTSSEQTAAYKAEIISGKSLIDITGGLGVDSYFFSKKFEQVIHCELNKNLSEIALYNFEILGIKNTSCFVKNGLEFLNYSDKKFDWIFIDPSRRNDTKGKVFLLQDCLPDVPSNLEVIFEKTENVMLKTSPLLDISQGTSELKFVKEIHVVAIKNEVKELLWILEKGYQGEIKTKTINLQNNQSQKFHFMLSDEKSAVAQTGLPKKYLYEPNAAIMKSGGFKSVSAKFGLQKIYEHSHLYTSNQLLDFPGRVFKVIGAIPYKKKELKNLGIKKANITTRNFPESVASLRKMLKIKDGGEDYLFFTTDMNGQRIMISCKKISPNKTDGTS